MKIDWLKAKFAAQDLWDLVVDAAKLLHKAVLCEWYTINKSQSGIADWCGNCWKCYVTRKLIEVGFFTSFMYFLWPWSGAAIVAAGVTYLVMVQRGIK